MDHFSAKLSDERLSGISSLGLAHVGDAVYEILVRSHLCALGKSTSAGLHKATTARVCASAQAEAAQRLLPFLSEAELAVFKRGRNAKAHSPPKNAKPGDYALATALEALFGHLYLKGDKGRINELFDIILADTPG